MTNETNYANMQTMIDKKIDKGLQYSADYSSQFVGRTLVDRVYIDDPVLWTLHHYKFFKIIHD